MLSAVVGLAVLGACNGQGEGDSCDFRNGNNDCQNGYQCVTPPMPFMGMRCCPADPALATVPACKVSGVAVSGDAAPPPAGSADGGGDAAADATDDGAPGADAAGDGDPASDGGDAQPASEGDAATGVDAAADASADAPSD